MQLRQRGLQLTSSGGSLCALTPWRCFGCQACTTTHLRADQHPTIVAGDAVPTVFICLLLVLPCF